MGFSIPPFRNVLTGGPAGAADPKGNLGGIWYRAGKQEAAALPINAPSPNSLRGMLEVIGALTGEGVLGMWTFDQSTNAYKDLAWRWKKHDAILTAPAGHATVQPTGTKFDPIAFMPEVGGGAGPDAPYISMLGQSYYGDKIIDPVSAPVHTVVAVWDYLGPVNYNGTWTTSSASMSASPPSLPSAIPQPVVGWGNDNTWRLVVNHLTHWSGGPGAWVEDGQDQLGFFANNYAGASGPILCLPGLDLGTAVIEFNSTTNTVTLYAFNPATLQWVVAGTTILTQITPFAAPGSQLGGATNGPYYWTYYTHLNGSIVALLIFPNTAQFTTDLLSKSLLVPGTGPVTTSGIGYRASAPAATSISARLTEYSHYWPLDDHSPGPMFDVIAGVRLSVINPSQATFQVAGEDTTSPDGHVKAIQFEPVPGAFGTIIAPRLEQNAGPSAVLGTGGLGNDFTFAMRVLWEGPVAYAGNTPLIRSTTVPFSFVQETAIDIFIGQASAEPFGVTFRTWDSVGHVFDTLATSGFDWPATYTAPGGIPTKTSKWALLTCVYRTVGATIHKEIYVDGVLVASGSAAVGGWGQSVNLYQVGNGFKGSLEKLAFWPFALTAAEIEGL